MWKASQATVVVLCLRSRSGIQFSLEGNAPRIIADLLGITKSVPVWGLTIACHVEPDKRKTLLFDTANTGIIDKKKRLVKIEIIRTFY